MFDILFGQNMDCLMAVNQRFENVDSLWLVAIWVCYAGQVLWHLTTNKTWFEIIEIRRLRVAGSLKLFKNLDTIDALWDSHRHHVQ